MATLRYKNPTTQKWELVGVGGGGSAGGDQIVFSKKAEFPAVGDSSKIYVDTVDSRTYIWKDNDYVLVGDGQNSTDWQSIK